MQQKKGALPGAPRESKSFNVLLILQLILVALLVAVQYPQLMARFGKGSSSSGGMEGRHSVKRRLKAASLQQVAASVAAAEGRCFRVEIIFRF